MHRSFSLPSSRPIWSKGLATALLQLAMLSIAGAQDLDNVSISGRVMDQTGAIIPGARVDAVLSTTGLRRTTTAAGDGRYRLIQLEPGVYTLIISVKGFATLRSDLTTIAGQNVQLDMTLLPEGVAVAPITISAADTSSIDTSRTLVGGTITTEEIEQLPIASRSPLDLIFTLPGVSEEPLRLAIWPRIAAPTPSTLQRKRDPFHYQADRHTQTT